MSTKQYDPYLGEEVIILEWRDLAACAGHDPSIFFPAGETGPAAEQTAQANAICSTCEGTADCLTDPIETNQVSGIWGGLTEDERRRIRRRWLADRRRRTG